ncbi:MAG: GTP 3',8-cyclase MoaA [Rhodospirillales bacterium]|jgi:GTP 3',8-cyclase|nr:GTP 3',8-cyclase MoaA [Rhodospirillales bacterium]
MKDPFGRKITYLRVSVTDRCNFRCTYCMAEDMVFLPKAEILSLEELDRICTAFIDRGVRKLRLSGGEPLVRRGVMTLFRSLGRHLDSGDLDELTLTTNATQLAKHAAELFDCGVRRVNVSMDTLDPKAFDRLTRGGRLDQVLEGLDAAAKAGLAVKINAVALRGVNEAEIPDLVGWCGERGFDLTLIETMPMGEIDADRTDYYLPLAEVRERLESRWTLSDITETTGGPSRYVRVGETGKKVGFITPMSHNFCEGCNRVRLTCTGKLYMCLGQDDHADLRAAVRESESDETLAAAIDAAIARKPKGHDFVIDPTTNTPAVQRHMNVTGG